MLAERILEDREPHNSRLFVDLCENIHIHFREYRFVFSLPEYFEFIDIISKSTEDVRSYLAQNPDYEEGRYGTTLMVAGGRARQMKFLQQSPQPNQTTYFNNSLRIELQEEYVTDEIHIHYRDFRLCLNRANFKDIAGAFEEANRTLSDFEATHQYKRARHGDRDIQSWAQSEEISQYETQVMGTSDVPIGRIRSNWYRDIRTDWNPDPAVIGALRQAIRRGDRLSPIILVKDAENDTYVIIDGHHRVRAAIEEKKSSLNAVVLEGLSFEDTKPLRQAEEHLKEFDKEHLYKFRTSEFLRNYLSYSLNDYYRDQFHHSIKQPGLFYRFLRQIKRKVLMLPLPRAIHLAVENVSGSKRYWR